ncbi:MAG: transposase-like zinc-binding domain-containing protein [Pseudanabaena sp.]|jgi:transposase-like protein
MTEIRPSCPTCQSISVVKNGSTRHGKRQFNYEMQRLEIFE